jgi:hypothetical protein
MCVGQNILFMNKTKQAKNRPRPKDRAKKCIKIYCPIS